MKLITYPIAVSWMNERRTAIPMSSSNSARRQNETATAIATSASVAATSPTLTWIDGLVTGGLSAAISRREHRVHAHRQVHPLPGAGEQRPGGDRLRRALARRRQSSRGRQWRRGCDQAPVRAHELELARRRAPNDEASLVDQPMMVAAEHDQVLEARFAPLCPVVNVMGVN